jgi:DNA mismatch repair protein MutS
MENVTLTPDMEQFHKLKTKYPDAILLFRIGDFYESFSSDAHIVAEILSLTTCKSAGEAAEMVVFPHYALDSYLPKLVRAGKRVAICDLL